MAAGEGLAGIQARSIGTATRGFWELDRYSILKAKSCWDLCCIFVRLPKRQKTILIARYCTYPIPPMGSECCLVVFGSIDPSLAFSFCPIGSTEYYPRVYPDRVRTHTHEMLFRSVSKIRGFSFHQPFQLPLSSWLLSQTTTDVRSMLTVDEELDSVSCTSCRYPTCTGRTGTRTLFRLQKQNFKNVGAVRAMVEEATTVRRLCGLKEVEG